MSPHELCQCDKCVQSSTKHHITGEQVQGLYLPKTTVALHKKSSYISSRQSSQSLSPLVASSILATSPVTAERNSGLLSSSINTAPNGKASHSSPAVNSGLNERVPVFRSGVAVDGRVKEGTSRTPVASELTEAHALRIDQLLQELDSKKSRFESQFRGIVFSPDYSQPLSSDPPPLCVAQNEFYLLHVDFVKRIHTCISKIPVSNQSFLNNKRSTALNEVKTYNKFLESLVKTAWVDVAHEHHKSRNTPLATRTTIDHSSYFEVQESLKRLPAVFITSYIIVAILHLLSGLSREDSNLLLGALELTITMACHDYLGDYLGTSDASTLPDPMKTLGKGEKWRADVRTAMNALHLDPELIDYSCCKKCYTCYGKVDGKYPVTCDFRETMHEDSKRCGTRLTMDDDSHSSQPIQTFSYQPIASFVARLLARPRMLEEMEKTVNGWDKSPPFCSDFYGADAVREFNGPDGKTRYLEVPAGELRLLFTLFIDWFNPYGNKVSGKAASIGGIYMICLNLPVHIRYHVQNVYIVGIIPGPGEPSLHHMNHVLRPLVADLLVLWNTGVKLSRTSARGSDRLVRAAIIALVADSPAARKTAGFPGVTSKFFCTFCLQTYSRSAAFNLGLGPSREKSEHMLKALRWKNAATEADRKEIWAVDEVRWSELMLLPYWDATKFLVVDPMHNLFLNLVSHHVRDLWGIHDSKSNGRKGAALHDTAAQTKSIDHAHESLLRKDLNGLKNVRRPYLDLLAGENKVKLSSHDKKNITNLATALIDWWSAQPAGAVLVKPVPFPMPTADVLDAKDPKYLLDEFVVGEIHKDMQQTSLPGWIGRPPANFGSKSHGKLSADHWRTSFTVNLVITLVRLWGQAPSSERQQSLLNNFLALVAVIRYATARRTSEKHIRVVEAQLQVYFDSLNAVSEKRYPAHHHSLHIPECLRRFGPAHGWWAYPYERYNGIMQRLNHNNHLSQIPTTFIKSFCQGANLKAIVHSDLLPPSFGPRLKHLLDRFICPDLRGALFSYVSATGDQETHTDTALWQEGKKGIILNADEYEALAEHLNGDPIGFKYSTKPDGSRQGIKHLYPLVQDRTMVGRKGVHFATAKYSIGNSLVIFRSSAETQPRPGQIQRIFVHSRPSASNQNIQEIFYAVKEFLPLGDDEAHLDPYRKFPLVDVKLYRDELASKITMIRTPNIISHFASCPYRIPGSPHPYRVVLSLDRELADV